MNDDDGLSPQVGRYGERVHGGGVSFRCAACGEMAAVVRLVRAGATVNMGPPLGERVYDRRFWDPAVRSPHGHSALRSMHGS